MVPMTTLYDGRFHHAGPHEPSAATPPKWVLPFAAAVLRTPQVTLTPYIFEIRDGSLQHGLECQHEPNCPWVMGKH